MAVARAATGFHQHRNTATLGHQPAAVWDAAAAVSAVQSGHGSHWPLLCWLLLHVAVPAWQALPQAAPSPTLCSPLAALRALRPKHALTFRLATLRARLSRPTLSSSMMRFS